jgi:hypothetical protein
VARLFGDHRQNQQAKFAIVEKPSAMPAAALSAAAMVATVMMTLVVCAPV